MGWGLLDLLEICLLMFLETRAFFAVILLLLLLFCCCFVVVVVVFWGFL